MSVDGNPNNKVWRSPSTAPQPVPDGSFAARQTRRDTAESSQYATAAYGSHMRPVADPGSKLVGYRTSFLESGRLLLGMIMDGTAVANCYRVQVEKGTAPIIATACTHGSGVCLGASEITTYAPGTSVIVMMHDNHYEGYILGAVPFILDVGNRAYHDYISQASRKRVDDVHKKHLKQPDGGQQVDYSAWRPFDATLASEWGAISTTGIGVTLDDFMVRMSVNEFTGVFGFYHDSLLRVTGYNMQVWTSGHERDAFTDQAEYNDVQGYSPYPWEAMGLMSSGLEMIEEYQPGTYQCALQKPFYAHWENKHEFQQPYHRTQQFYGYLGQGSRTHVHAPPQSVPRWTYEPGQIGSPGKPYESTVQSKDLPAGECTGGDTKLTDHEVKPVYGLHEDNVGLDGRRFIASAKGIVLSKRILLPFPQRIKRPEDEKGDNAETNYKAASKFGSGPEHKITGDIETTDTDWPNMQRAAAVLDLHGYLFNYAGIHPFYWHAKDYKTWEQSDLSNEGYADVNQKIPQFSELQGSMYLKQPQPKKWNIDHRYNEQNFYEAESFISLLEDGSVVIGDGYGAEIRMAGGCLTLSAPGDVWVKSGRHAQIWAGSDCIFRAHDGVDISTTEKSVRIKSEKHVMVLAGNEGNDGGVLIESRSSKKEYDFETCGDDVKFGGVVLRAPKSNIVGLGSQIYMRTGGGSIQPGEIVLDADKGKKNIVTKSENLFNYVGQGGSVYHFFGLTDYQKANMFSEQITLLSGMVGTEKMLVVGGGILSDGSVLVKKGHILTQAAAQGAIFVGPCDGDCQGQVGAAIDTIRNLIDDQLPQVGATLDQTLLEMQFYGDKKPGNDRVIDIMEFSFRTDDQYAVPDFLLYEDRWQQMAEIGGQTTKKWEEKGVESKICEKTYPFPGKKWLVDEDAYVQQEFNIVEFQDGGFRDMDRGEAPGLNGGYSQPKFADNNKTIINGNYPIIGRK
jgi:hypothetical protein